MFLLLRFNVIINALTTDVLLTPSSSLAAQLSLHTSHPPPSSTTYTNTAISTTLTTSTVTPINTASNEDEEEDASPLIWTSIKCKPNGTVECLVQEVPEFLLANLLQLFPGMSLHGEEKLSVIVLSQRTVNDMMSWSIEVEAERMQLLEYVSPVIIHLEIIGCLCIHIFILTHI